MEIQRPTIEQEQEYYLSAYLDFVSESFENVVESTLDNAIFSIINNQKERVNKADISNNTESIEYLNDTLIPIDDYYNYLYELEDKQIIFALYELKIIYLYKHFEIYLRELSGMSYEDWKTNNKVNNWDGIVKYYLSKDINLKNLNNYELVFELGRVNNSLKHSGKKINKNIKNIPEFKRVKLLESVHLKAFYLRVKDAPKDFIKELAFTIHYKLFPSVKQDYEFEIDDSIIEFDTEI